MSHVMNDSNNGKFCGLNATRKSPPHASCSNNVLPVTEVPCFYFVNQDIDPLDTN